MGTDDDIIRNGTWSQWLNYTVVLGGKKSEGYESIAGGVRIKGRYVLIVAAVIGAVVGALVG